MIRATLDLHFELPRIKAGLPLRVSDAELPRLLASGSRNAPSPEISRILSSARALRAENITWAFNLSLAQLTPRQVHTATGSRTSMPAPLAIFKIRHGVWIPKIVVQYVEEYQLNSEDLLAYHRTCRLGGMQFLCITSYHLDRGYLESKDFKRAFNGAFFCEESQPTPIFCPTLREAHHFSWPD